MSLHSAMLTGVTGLTAYSSALSVTSSNISNSNTTGFKGSTTEFSTLLAGVTNSSTTMGLSVQNEQDVTAQGELTSTSSSTDLAISGQGFFVCSTESDGSNVEYTRSGSFTTNNDYQLVNSAGLYLQAYPVTTNSDGTTTVGTSLSDVVLDKNSGAFETTSAISLDGNLESTTDVSTSTTTTADYTTTLEVYDSQGGTQELNLAFTKSDTNEWTYTLTYAGDDTNVTSTTLDTGTVTFGSDGSLESIASTGGNSVTGGTVSFTIPWSSSSGLASTTGTGQTVSLDFGTLGGTDGLTQYATTSAVLSTSDGAAYGTVSSYAVDTDGTVSATYTNGLSRDLYQVPVATFADADGLTSVSGTAYIASDASGKAIINTAGTNGSGTIKSENLEDSTVDIATELTDLINTQRAYSACAKIVSTATTMLDTLTSLGS